MAPRVKPVAQPMSLQDVRRELEAANHRARQTGDYTNVERLEALEKSFDLDAARAAGADREQARQDAEANRLSAIEHVKRKAAAVSDTAGTLSKDAKAMLAGLDQFVAGYQAMNEHMTDLGQRAGEALGKSSDTAASMMVVWDTIQAVMRFKGLPIHGGLAESQMPDVVARVDQINDGVINEVQRHLKRRLAELGAAE